MTTAYHPAPGDDLILPGDTSPAGSHTIASVSRAGIVAYPSSGGGGEVRVVRSRLRLDASRARVGGVPAWRVA